jgi:hypothetical protein
MVDGGMLREWISVSSYADFVKYFILLQGDSVNDMYSFVPYNSQARTHFRFQIQFSERVGRAGLKQKPEILWILFQCYKIALLFVTCQ